MTADTDAALVRRWMEANKPRLDNEQGVGDFEEAWGAALRLAAAAERADDESDLEHQSSRRAYWRARAEGAESALLAAQQERDYARIDRDYFAAHAEELAEPLEVPQTGYTAMKVRAERAEATNTRLRELPDLWDLSAERELNRPYHGPEQDGESRAKAAVYRMLASEVRTALAQDTEQETA